jgi:hypothetical protein
MILNMFECCQLALFMYHILDCGINRLCKHRVMRSKVALPSDLEQISSQLQGEYLSPLVYGTAE